MEKVLVRYAVLDGVFYKETTTYIKAGHKTVSEEDPRLGAFVGDVFVPTEYVAVKKPDPENPGSFIEETYRKTIPTKEVPDSYFIKASEGWLVESITGAIPDGATPSTEEEWLEHIRKHEEEATQFPVRLSEQQQVNKNKKAAALLALGMSEEDVKDFL